jgi:hypothetical protein
LPNVPALTANIFAASVNRTNIHNKTGGMQHLLVYLINGLYYKNVTIVNDTSRVVRNDAPKRGITYDDHLLLKRCH